MIHRLYLLLLFSCFICSCTVRQKTLFNAPSDLVIDTIKRVYVVNDHGVGPYYKIKIGDKLAINNVQNKEFGGVGSNTSGAGGTTSGTTSGAQNNQGYPVDTDGSVDLPAIGKVAVAGLSRREAALKIQELYGQKHLVDPIIELNIVNLKVTLLGEFSKQGNYLLERENTTLIDVIGEAGGITKTADPKSLKIIRGDRSAPEIIYVNLSDINSLASKKLILQDQDIITIQQTKNAAATEKLQNSNTFLQPILVVVNLAVLVFTLTRR